MSQLQTLRVDKLRNLAGVSIERFAPINLITGPNGSGKTSVLEAIHILGLGRSFRVQRALPLIHYEADRFEICGTLRSRPESTLDLALRIIKARNASDSIIEVQGSRSQSVADLAALLPLQLINSDTFLLLEGSPKIRRQYLDWGVFHVEHEFMTEWKRWQRALKQRNSLLRRGKMQADELDSWDCELIGLVNAITDKRQRYLAALEPVILDVLYRLWPEAQGLELAYQRGWDKQRSYEEVLSQQRERDAQLGFTQFGCHRADVKFKMQGVPVGEVLSRGQLKLLACSLRIAQAVFLQGSGIRRCVLLVDDLPAELDRVHRELLCRELESIGCQVFVTAIDAESVEFQCGGQQELRVFHVEHGKVRTI